MIKPNIAVIGTPKCGHAFLVNLLLSIYSLSGIPGEDLIVAGEPLPKGMHGKIFNAHVTPSSKLVQELADGNWKVICPIRNPLDCLLSLLYFYRRHPNELLDQEQKELVRGEMLINDSVVQLVESGSFEAWYANSYLWQHTGGYLVKFENLVRSPLKTLRTICDQVSLVDDRKILGAYFANQIDIFSSLPGHLLHFSSHADSKYRSYDWSELIASNKNASVVFELIKSSPIYEPYNEPYEEENIPHHELILGDGSFPFLLKLFYLSEFFESDNICNSFENYRNFAFSPIDGNKLVINGIGLELWKLREDLQTTFPDPAGSDRCGYATWLLNQAGREYGIPRSALIDTLRSVTSFSL